MQRWYKKIIFGGGGGLCSERNIELFQSYLCILLSCYICYNLYLYYFISENYLNLSSPLVFSYFIVDILICKYDIKIHHLLIIFLISFNYYYNVSIHDSAIPILSLYKTEISTFFYSFKIIMKNNEVFNKYFSQINNILFIVTFTKFRIYDVYYNVLINPLFYSQMSKYTDTIFKQLFLYIPIYCFYGLNIYWFTIMCKIIAKQIIKKYKSHSLIKKREFYTQYTLFLNIYITGYIYSFFQKQYYIFDMVGTIMLSLNSYIYHNKIYTFLLENKQINYLDNEIIEPLVNDNLSIHIYSALYNLTAVSSYENINMFAIFYISLLLHLNSIYNYILYIIKIKNNNSNIIRHNDESSNELIFVTNLYTVIPVSYDIIFSIFNATNITTKINLSLISYCLFLILYMTPFYDLNHFAFHIGLIIQRIFLTYSIIGK